MFCSLGYLSNDLSSRIFILVFFVGAWVIPMITILFSYVSIIRIVTHSRSSVAQIANQGNTDGSINQPNINYKVEMKVVRNAVGLIIGWIAAWTPYAIVALMGISGYGHLLTPLSATIPALFAKLTACIEPFIYALNKPKIRQEIRRRYMRHGHQPNRPINNSSYTITSARSYRMALSRRLTATPSINIQQQWQTTSL